MDETTWLHLGMLNIRAPVSAGTNLLLAVQCLFSWHVLKDGRAEASRTWTLFFLGMSVTTLFGAAKHGAQHAISEDTYLAVLWVTGVGSAIATFFAQRAAFGGWLPHVQLAAFLVAGLLLGPDMIVVVVNTVVGLGLVMVVEAVRGWRGRPGSLAIAGAIAISTGTVGIYLAELSVGPWLNHIDLAHVSMGVSLWLMLRGAQRADGGPAWTWR
jgi:hypothetical protein